MYYLLIEAAGISQMSRLEKRWYGEFIAEITGAMEAGAFHLVAQDRDLLFFQDRQQKVRHPEEVADLLKTADRLLSVQGEYLLEYIVLADYRENVAAGTVFPAMERLLRHVRIRNGVHATEPVALALEPVVELVQTGEIYQIVAFRDEYWSAVRRYVDFLADDKTVGAVSELLFPSGDREGPRRCWIVTTDISRISASIHAASVGPVFTISDGPRDGQRDGRRTLQELFWKVCAEFLHDEREASLDPPAAVLVNRFSAPGHDHLSTPYLTGELRYALERLLDATDSYSATIVIEEGDEEDGLVPLLLSSSPAARIVVVSSGHPFSGEDVPENRWRVLSVHTDGKGERAYRYWAQLDGRGERLPGEDTEPEGVLHVAAASLGGKHRTTLYYLHCVSSLLSPEMMDELFVRSGISRAERIRIVKDLTRTGFLVDTGFPTVHRLVSPVIDGIFGDEGLALRREIDDFLLDLLENGRIPLTPDLWDFVQERLPRDTRTALFHRYLHRIAVGGNVSFYRQRIVTSEKTFRDDERLATASVQLRLYLRDSRGPEECDSAFQTIEEVLPYYEGRGEADIHLSTAEYFLARRDYPGALKSVKRAVLLQQGDAVPDGAVAASYLLMARIMFAQRRLSDAGQYLGFAMDQREDDDGSVLVARSLDAIRLFLVGNLSRAAVAAEKQLRPLLERGFSDWYVLLRFLQGRIHFELGEYARAAEQFSRLYDFCSSCTISAPLSVLRVWREYSLYLVDGDDSRVEDALTGEERRPEVLLFLAEALTADGRYAEALPLLEEAITLEEMSDRWPRLGVTWDNGYASIEDLVIANAPGSSQLLRILKGFYALTLAHLDRQDEAVPIFYSLTRGADVSNLDPYTGLYNFLYSSVLPEERSRDRDDRTTVLGRSVKLIQERTSRMDEYRDKLRYLRQNAWNKQMMEAARRHNLV